MRGDAAWRAREHAPGMPTACPRSPSMLRVLNTKALKGKSPWIYKVVPILNSTHVLNSLLHLLSIPAF